MKTEYLYSYHKHLHYVSNYRNYRDKLSLRCYFDYYFYVIMSVR